MRDKEYEIKKKNEADNFKKLERMAEIIATSEDKHVTDATMIERYKRLSVLLKERAKFLPHLLKK